MSDESFWDFSLRVYAKKGVADACLTLQDRFGLDVNLVLFCVWYGVHYGTLPASTLSDAIEFSLAWRDRVVQPLRTSRRWMKEASSIQDSSLNDYAELRNNIKRIELQAERLQQNKLASLAVDHLMSNAHNPKQSWDENLAAYLDSLPLKPNKTLRANYAQIVSATSDQAP